MRLSSLATVGLLGFIAWRVSAPLATRPAALPASASPSPSVAPFPTAPATPVPVPERNAWQASEFALVRARVLATIPEGLLVEGMQVTMPQIRSDGMSTIDGAGIMRALDKNEFGPVLAMSRGRLKRLDLTSSNQPLGLLVLRDYPEPMPRPGAKFKVIAAPLLNWVAYKREPLPTYTMRYQLPKTMDWPSVSDWDNPLNRRP